MDYLKKVCEDNQLKDLLNEVVESDYKQNSLTCSVEDSAFL